LSQIGKVQDALTSIPAPVSGSLGTSVGSQEFTAGVYQGSAVNMPADTVITLNGNGIDGAVWIFNLTDALTMGAGTRFDISNASNPIVIWNVGGALNLGAGTEFFGTAYISGSVSGATSTVSCGNLYAKGALSIGSIGQGVSQQPCPTASTITVTVDEDGKGSF
jgi:hypothetical protein